MIEFTKPKKPKSPSPKANENDITLAQRIVFKARIAAAGGKTEVAIALFEIIAEHFDWGDGNETTLETCAERSFDPSSHRDKA